MMDSSLSMVAHVNHIRQTGYFYLNWIRKVRRFLTEEAAKTIVNVLVISKIDYCNSILVNLPECVISKPQGLMNAAARVVTCTLHRDHITPALKKMHWLPVRQRVNFKVLTLTFKSLQNEAPSYISEIVHEYRPNRKLRSELDMQLRIPRIKNNYGKRCFRYAAPTLWNSLPKHIKMSENTVVFKKKLKTHIFKDYYG